MNTLTMKIKIQDLFFPNEETRDTTPDNKDPEAKPPSSPSTPSINATTT